MNELKEKIRALLLKARALSAKAEGENREFTDEERTEVGGYLTEAEGLRKKLKALEGDAAITKAISDLGEGLDLADDKDGAVKTVVKAMTGTSFGEQFLKSEGWQGWLKQFPGGRIPDSAKGLHSPAIAITDLFKSLSATGRKDIITGGSVTSGGAFVSPDITGIFIALGRRPITLLDVIPTATTGSNAVEFVRQTSRTNNAAGVAEATGNPDAPTGGLKPWSAFAFEQVTSNVITIAHGVAVTRQGLSDAGQLRAIIDMELREGLREETEDQVMNGTGTNQLLGLENTPGTLSQAFVTDNFVTTRRAKTFIRMVGRSNPSLYLFNPEDWEAIELERDNNDRFYGNGPFSNTEPKLWGVPVLETEVVPQGKGWLIDPRYWRIWDREQASIAVTDSHEDFFMRNLVAVRAETRLAFGVTRPSAFVEIALTPGT